MEPIDFSKCNERKLLKLFSKYGKNKIEINVNKNITILEKYVQLKDNLKGAKIESILDNIDTSKIRKRLEELEQRALAQLNCDYETEFTEGADNYNQNIDLNIENVEVEIPKNEPKLREMKDWEYKEYVDMKNTVSIKNKGQKNNAENEPRDNSETYKQLILKIELSLKLLKNDVKNASKISELKHRLIEIKKRL
jgi:hypothetical protein